MERRALFVIATLAALGCGGDDNRCALYGDCDAASARSVVETMASLESAETWALMQSNGDGLFARVDLLERGLVPGIENLVLGGETATALMREKLRTGDGYAMDHALTIYAYVLGRMGDEESLEVLADLVETTSFGTDLVLAPHAATDAIFQIVGDPEPRRNEFLDYPLPARDAAVVAARAGTVKQPASQTQGSCQIAYTLVDNNGNPLTYERNGESVEATFECTRHANFEVPPNFAGDKTAEIEAGGGTFVSEHDGGKPSLRYNCAGFSFREFTNADSFNCTAPKMRRVLVGVGALTKISVSEAKVNDKVFFRSKQNWSQWWDDEEPSTPHVAVVHSFVDGEPMLRAPDNQSGVFDARIDAQYFTDAWNAEVYEWTNGVVPRVVSAIKAGEDPRYCSDECGNGCSDDEVCLDGSCVPKTPQTSCELRMPQCCPGQDNSCTAPEAQCFCDAYCVTANDCCPDACSICGYCE